jgi:DNA-binding transcriptional regulator YiaG
MTSLLQTHDEERLAGRTSVWLKEMRKTLRLEQADLARAAGVHRNTVSRWERALSVPTVLQVDRLKIFEKNQRRARGLR